MKKRMIFSAVVLAVVLSINVKGQTWMPIGSDLVTDLATNNVGIGTPFVLPSIERLTVEGNLHLWNTDDAAIVAITRHSYNGAIGIFSGANSGSDGSCLVLSGTNNATNPGQVGFIANITVPTSKPAYSFLTYDGSSWLQPMAITHDNRVVIGTDIIYNTPGDYNLYVSKGILTEKLKVANSGDPANWSDFVFAKNYSLMPLNKVEAYVKANKHLPEIPSAEEVAKDGIDVMDMDAKLLQKIEELTLYVIQQQKEIDELKKKAH